MHIPMKFLLVFTLTLMTSANFDEITSAQHAPNTITFDNQSGEFAIVKLVGPTKTAVEVPNGQERTVHVETGDYFLLGRYGTNAEEYKYTKGDPFKVSQPLGQYSAITITLHKVIEGNYRAEPVSGDEFEKTRILAQTPETKPLNSLFEENEKIVHWLENNGPYQGSQGMDKTDEYLLCLKQAFAQAKAGYLLGEGSAVEILNGIEQEKLGQVIVENYLGSGNKMAAAIDEAIQEMDKADEHFLQLKEALVQAQAGNLYGDGSASDILNGIRQEKLGQAIVGKI